MCLKEGKDCQAYEVLDMHLEPELERRLKALGLTAGTKIEILNNKKKGVMIVKFRGVRFAFGSRIADHVLVRELPY